MLNKEIFFVSLLITFCLTTVFVALLIPFLIRKRYGQPILDIGPSWHKTKEGTPTMGGIAFVASSFVAFIVILLCFGNEMIYEDIVLTIDVYIFALLNSLVGIIDDLAKIRNKRNEGLTPKAKLLFQFIISVLFVVLLKITVGLDTTLNIPFVDSKIELGVLFYVLSILILCGVVNAVNLTDGLDGLASSTVLTVGGFSFFLSFTLIERTSLSFVGGVLIGATVGFLIFNLPPARIFMGDTGSLFLGALVVGTSFILKNPLYVIIYGAIFIIEALSVILQVVYFKFSKGKRLFKMAPLHHHLEKCGVSEMKIVAIFSILNLVFCFAMYFGIYGI